MRFTITVIVNEPTEKLFYKDSYGYSFDATVYSCIQSYNSEDASQARYEIVLDRTCFFPEGGGQGSDRGVIRLPDGGPVLQVFDVRLADSEIVHYAHVTDADGGSAHDSAVREAFREGVRVQGEIDFHRRFDFMQQHTGEHIVSGIICGTYGYDNVGFRLADDHVTMDYSGVLTLEQVSAVEKQANEAVWKNLPVIVSFPSEEEQKTLVYRSKIEIPGDDLRIVEIPGIDVCACCAPHVKTTGEIGLIKITRLQNWKGGVRLSMVCGARALSLMQAEHDMVTTLAKNLSTSWENIPDRFDKMKHDLGSCKKELKDLKKQYGVKVPGADRPAQA